MGFDTSHLFYAIVTADPRTRGNRKFRSSVITTAIKNGLKEAVIEIEDTTIYVNKFTLMGIESNLVWAIDYWKQNREATATNNPNKCVRCEYQIHCQTIA